ncbi:MAG: hypothetical protein JWO36_2748 [Myxococcales bacterium]|nr:hypothetical protein [Myxococcales bacterium]
MQGSSSQWDAGCVSPMKPSADDLLLAQLRRDFEARADRPSSDSPPIRGTDGHWRTHDGAPISFVGVLSWTRPPQNDGSPITAYASAGEHRYWVHQGGVLGATEFWFGPFELPATNL